MSKGRLAKLGKQAALLALTVIVCFEAIRFAGDWLGLTPWGQQAVACVIGVAVYNLWRMWLRARRLKVREDDVAGGAR